MQVMYQRCADIDVHQRFLVFCLTVIEAGERRKEIRTFRNETRDRLALRARMLEESCSHVAPVLSSATWVTPKVSSQSERAKRSAFMVKKVRICFCTAPEGSVIITQATIAFLWT
ncbi:hypothetical protein [Dictyobacter aurantiacus]|uniref:Uncharacterized protein n=1 Tax=Dictyobacter aurantiacus TaxID=1936993 RepID=A0A401ZTF1_9CHLR|nr:hypothetical protein [Dictyobacter aurantiacus]GCE10076.1 hypothetical protein KDAU_74050 [Dictyobacter aurantiacus]